MKTIIFYLKNNILSILGLVCISLIFFLMNYYTPLLSDDYNYSFIYNKWTGERPSLERISSLKDIFISQYSHYFTVNGRLIPHLFEQYFAGLAGKMVFNILNTIVLIIFLLLISDLILFNSKSKHELRPFVIILSFLASLFLFAVPGETELWMAGSLNYLWPMTGTLGVLYIIQRDRKSVV